MKDVIQEIIGKKPYLADPLRFYQKVVRFVESMKERPLPVNPVLTAYPPEETGRILALFSSSLELPESMFSPLRQAMELREIDFTRLPRGETPAFSLPYGEDDLAILLNVLSRPWFLQSGKACGLDGIDWEEGKCPVCNAQPAVTWIEEDDRRRVSCSFCSTEGYVSRSGCSLCRGEDVKDQMLLVFEGEEGFIINTCDLCRSYAKTIEKGIIRSLSPEVADLVSLPLDIVAQEQGYVRRSPNPIGMRKITARG